MPSSDARKRKYIILRLQNIDTCLEKNKWSYAFIQFKKEQRAGRVYDKWMQTVTASNPTAILVRIHFGTKMMSECFAVLHWKQIQNVQSTFKDEGLLIWWIWVELYNVG